MGIKEILTIIKQVLLRPEIIGITLVIILYISAINSVVYYKKKIPKAKIKKEKPTNETAEKVKKEKAPKGKSIKERLQNLKKQKGKKEEDSEE